MRLEEGREDRLAGWVCGEVGRRGGGTVGQWCYSDLASSLASSGAASTWERTKRKKKSSLLVFGASGRLPPAGAHLVGLGLSVLRVVLLVGLCLGVLLCLLGLLVLLLVIHSLFFLLKERRPF